jgi:hypothetical protein
MASVENSQINDEMITLVINNGGNVNATTVAYNSTLAKSGSGTPTDIALIRGNFETADLFRQFGGKTTGELIESLQNKTIALEKLISDKHKADTPNPTDEWPRKMWEIDFFHDEDRIPYPASIGYEGASLLLSGTNRRFYWVSRDGELFEIPNLDNLNSINFPKYIRYFNSANFVISNRAGDTVTMYSRIGGEVVQKEFKGTVDFPSTSGKGIPQSSHIGISRDGDTGNLICWDFTPPSSTAPKPDDGNGGGNGGGNETANSRISITTDGPDIALVTDGKLGAAELQKSNDLRSWRRLGDVPAEASEVPVTPRESGNEFYRLKKN